MPAPLPTASMRREYASALCALSPGGNRSTVAPVVIHGWPRELYVIKQGVEAFQALSRIMAAHRYTFDEGAGGTLVCRAITAGSLYSPHAYGIAIDINPSRNPYSPSSVNRLVTDMPRSMINDIKSIRTADSNRQVFEWGGDYRTIKDAMHFQIGARKNELAEGLVGPGTDPATDPAPTGGEWMYLGLTFDGTKSELGKALQLDIVWAAKTLKPGWDPLPTYGVDGEPGDETAKAFGKIIGQKVEGGDTIGPGWNQSWEIHWQRAVLGWTNVGEINPDNGQLRVGPHTHEVDTRTKRN